MTKLLIMTDIHIVEPGERIIGLDPSARFAEALAHALRDHGDAAHLILTGDLTHHGRPEQYARLKALIADVPMPVTLLIGNHDDRATFQAAFPEAARDENGFVQTVIDTDTHRLICLDTVDPNTAYSHGGHLCAARMAWLEAQLAGSDKPCLIFQHHPPARTGFDGMDVIGLNNAAEERAMLARYGARHVIAGHIHRTMSGNAGGISYSLLKSPCHQMPMTLGPSPATSSVDEPGAFGIVLLGEDEIIVHTEDVGLTTEIAHDAASAG